MMDMMLLQVAEKAMVAGASEGAGAEEVVWVFDKADLDLSKNSTILYHQC
jgi:hypothetical protein